MVSAIMTKDSVFDANLKSHFYGLLCKIRSWDWCEMKSDDFRFKSRNLCIQLKFHIIRSAYQFERRSASAPLCSFPFPFPLIPLLPLSMLAYIIIFGFFVLAYFTWHIFKVVKLIKFTKNYYEIDRNCLEN